MSKASQNLTGLWHGDYAYPGHIGPTTPFLARIEDRDGRLFGTIIEPEMFSGAGTQEAGLDGHRQGFSVDFVKIYSPTSADGYDMPVDYVGRLSDDGLSVTGMWSLAEMNGTFEMHREIEAEALCEQQAVVEVPEPVSR
jgi:hypothetical protein